MQVGLIAHFEVPKKDIDQFMSAARSELKSVRENEPDCLRFDVILSDSNECRGAFVEVFASQTAAERHRSLPHFKAFHDAIKDIDVKWTTLRGSVID